MTKLWKLISAAILACVPLCASAQYPPGGPADIAGTYYASNFAGWTVPQGNNGPFAWSSAAVCQQASSGGVGFQPFVVGSPIRIVDTASPSQSENVTVTAVRVNGSGCAITTTSPAHQHLSFYLTSATGGLQEAINFSRQNYGVSPSLGVVITTADWERLGGTTGIIVGAAGGSNVSILDLRTSCPVSYTWSGSSYVGIDLCNGGGGGQTIIEVNGTPTSPVSPVNFVDSGTVTFQRTGATISATAAGGGGLTTLGLTTLGTSGPSTLSGEPVAGYLLNVPNYETSGSFQQQVIPPVTGQYVVIYPTSVVASGLQRATAVTTPGSIGAQLSFRIGCGGLAPCSAVFTWSGFTLPSYVNPANVTAVYTFGNYAGSEIILSHSIYQSSGPSGDAFPSSVIPAIAMQQSTELTAMTGAQVTGSSIQWTFGRTLNVPIGIIPSVNIASVGMIVYYSGPAPPTNTSIIVDPPLFFNGTSLDLGIDPLAINYLQPLLVQHLPDPTLSTGDIYQVTDGTSSSDCTTGGGSTVNLCRSNGTAWTIFTSGGGGGGAWSSLTNPTGNLSLAMGADTSTFTFGTNTGTTPWMQWLNSSGVGWGIAPDGSLRGVGSTTSHGMTIPAGVPLGTTAGVATVTSDSSGNLLGSDSGSGTTSSQICTVGNYTTICPSGGSSPLTTKGDLYTFSTANARLGVGADGLVLSADSTQATGLKWIAATGTGNTTSTALTTNVLPKANGANSIINSSLSDDGTKLSSLEPLQLGGPTNGALEVTYTGSAAASPDVNSVQLTIDGAVATPYNIPLPTSGPTSTNKYMNCAADPCVWDTGSGGGSGIPTSPSNALVKINGSGGAASSLSDSGTALSAPEPLTLTTTGNVPLTVTSSSTANTAFVLSNSNVTGEWIFEELGTASPAGMFFFNFFNATDHIPVGWDKTTLNTMLNGSSSMCWTSGSPIATSIDTCLSRSSAGNVSLDTTTAGNHLGNLSLNNLTVNGTCTGCGAGSSAFSAITGSTNTTAAMVVGSGASLAPTGTGTIQATSIASTVAVTSPITLTGSGTVASPYNIACPTCGTSSGGTSVSQNSGSTETNLAITGYMSQVCSDSSGSGTAQSCTVANTFTPQTGNCLVYKTTTANSGTGLSVNINSLGAKSIAVASSSGWTTTLVASSSIPANKPMNLCYDGTNWDASGTGYIPASGGSGSLVLLEEHTASSSADLEFTTRNVTGQSGASFQSDYDVYQVQIVNITPATNLVVPEWQFSTNGGSTWDASSVYKSVNFQMYSASGPSSPAVTTFFSPISQDAISNVAANGGEVGQFLVFNPLSTTVNKRISGLEYHFSTTDVMTNFSGTYQSTGAVNAMRLLMGSGNIATGTIRLYGVAK